MASEANGPPPAYPTFFSNDRRAQFVPSITLDTLRRDLADLGHSAIAQPTFVSDVSGVSQVDIYAVDPVSQIKVRVALTI